MGDKARAGPPIGVVDEEDDSGRDSSHLRSEGERSSPYAKDSGSSQVDQSGELRDSAPSPPHKLAPGELTDREVSLSTGSVEWQIVLQARAQRRTEELRKSSPTYDLQESFVEEQLEQSDVEADRLADLESCPSGSLGQSAKPEESGDFDLKVDQITDELLASILNDFKQDSGVKLEVEDVDEAQFEDKWPYVLDKKKEEPVHVPKPPVPQLSPAEEEEKKA